MRPAWLVSSEEAVPVSPATGVSSTFSPLFGFLLAMPIIFAAWQSWRRLSRRRAQEGVQERE